MAEANRKADMAVEREIAKFLDKHLWNTVESFHRTDTLSEQISGSDLVVTEKKLNLNNAVIDEKVAARYANLMLDTFSLELSFINKRGIVQDGWLLDTKKKTELYLFGWIDKAELKQNLEGKWITNDMHEESIKELEYCLVRRQDIIDYLEKRGWTLETLRKQDLNIRLRGFVKTFDFIDGVTFRYSKKYVEAPINILLKRDTYRELSVLQGKITI